MATNSAACAVLPGFLPCRRCRTGFFHCRSSNDRSLHFFFLAPRCRRDRGRARHRPGHRPLVPGARLQRCAARHRRRHARPGGGRTRTACKAAGPALRRLEAVAGRARGQGRGRALRPRRRPDQQRRRGGVQAGAPDLVRGMAHGARYQPGRRVPVHAGLRRADGRTRQRRGGEHRLHLGPAREHAAGRLRHQQGGADPPDQAACGGTGQCGRARERDCAGAGGNRDGQARAQRGDPLRLLRHHSARPLRHAGGNGQRRGLPVQRRGELHQRPGAGRRWRLRCRRRRPADPAPGHARARRRSRLARRAAQ